MKLYRVRGADDAARWVIEDERGQRRAVDLPFEALAKALMDDALIEGEALEGAWDEAAWLAPVVPSKVVCVGLNYLHHAQEMNKPLPEEPLLFMKPSTSVIGPGEAIRLPAQSQEVHHEGELAVVIGRRAVDLVSDEQALAMVLGYTCANDVTARDIQRREARYTRAKGFDTFCPLGPAIRLRRGYEPSAHGLSLRVNGAERQASGMRDMIFGVGQLVRFVSQIMTLLPGDVILTGTPSGVASLAVGDVVEVTIEGIGTLRNLVEARS